MKKEFQIKEPCNVGRENMKEISGGSFCDLCSKKVHDLSYKSDEEIRMLLDTNESICGRIQISRLYHQEETSKTNYIFFNFPFRKFASGIFLAAMFTSSINAQNARDTTRRPQEIEGLILYAPKRTDLDENGYYKSKTKEIKITFKGNFEDKDYHSSQLNILTLAKKYELNPSSQTVNFPEDEIGFKNLVILEKNENQFYTFISKKQINEKAGVEINVEAAKKVEFKPKNKTLYFIDGELISKEEYESRKKNNNIKSYFLSEIFAREILGNEYECEEGVILSYTK